MNKLEAEKLADESCTVSNAVKRTMEAKLAEKLKNVKHKLVVMSGKGGVGKSTVAANLALALSLRGHEVGLLDCDMHGPTIPKLLGVENQQLFPTESGIAAVFANPNLRVVSIGFLLLNQDTPVIWRGPLKMGAIRQFLEEINWGKLDYLIIDLPPGTGDEPLSIAQLIPNCDGALIVTTPQDVALLSVRKSINFAKALNLPVIGIIENMSGFKCPHCGKMINIFKSGGGAKAALDFNIPLLGKIPLDAAIVESGDDGRPFILEYHDTQTTRAFKEIVEKIEEIMNRGE
ncbi:MAG: Mrp/NBP35 family ATP-binding protein [Halobacteria archaeon]